MRLCIYNLEPKKILMRLIESISDWRSTGVTRLTIVTENGEGKVQVDLLNRDNKEYGRTAYIWDLYVHEIYRRKGIAGKLMDYALNRAREFGFETATLDWDLVDTPREIAYWYSRIGFEETEFGDRNARMVKIL